MEIRHLSEAEIGVQRLMESPTYWEMIVAAFMGAVGAGLFKLGEWVYLRPVLKLQHIHSGVGQRRFRASKKPIFEEVLSGQPLIKGYRQVGSDEIYIRMVAENTGRRVADRCRGFLINIEFEPRSGGERSQIYFDSIPLIWSYDLDNSLPDVDIAKDAWRTLDVIQTRRGKKEFFPCLNPKPIDYKFEESGTYYLTVVLTAQNAKAIRKTMVIDWKGKWDEFEVDGYQIEV